MLINHPTSWALFGIGLLAALNLSTTSYAQQNTPSQQGQSTQATRPNVIFILADDLRHDSLSLNGSTIPLTPNIDQLAAEGVYFSNALVTSPICGPSRANIFTGQWERKNQIGFTSVSNNFIDQETFSNSFQMQMKKAGYSTAFIGKHHTKIVNRRSTPLSKEIDFSYFKDGHLGFHPGKKSKTFSNLKNTSQIEGFLEACSAYLSPTQQYDYFYENADPSLDGMLDKRDPEKPFCIWVNFNLPHQASLGGMGSEVGDPDFYSTKYQNAAETISLPDGFDKPVKLPENILTRDELMNYYKFNRKSLINAKVNTARAVHGIDQFVANLRNFLAKIDEAKNTIIVFYSDNGLLYGEHGIGGKTMLYEESVRAPLIVYSPYFEESQRNTTREELVVGQDIPATILAMCGLSVPSSYQGVSMLPLINNPQSTIDPNWRKSVFLENLFTDQGYPRQDAVRSKNYKYIRYYSKDNDRNQYLPNGIEGEQPIYEQLFDLAADPEEHNNVADSPKYRQILDEHRAQCIELAKSLSQ